MPLGPRDAQHSRWLNSFKIEFLQMAPRFVVTVPQHRYNMSVFGEQFTTSSYFK